MHFLARLLNSTSDISDELAKDEHLFQEELHAFLASYLIKQKVLSHLLAGESLHHHLHRLQEALKDELAAISETERAEKEILQDLKYLSKEEYINRLEQMCNELKQARERDAYARAVIEELHGILLAEARKAKRALAGDTDPTLRESIIDLLMIERHLVEKLATIEDLEHFFDDLSYGTKRRAYVSHIERRFEERIEQHVQSIDVDEKGIAHSTSDHYLAQLTARIFNRLENAIMRAVENGSIEHHPYVDVEFVNSSLFDAFVRREIGEDAGTGKIVPSDRTIMTFLKVFKQLYNRQNPAGSTVAQQAVA